MTLGLIACKNDLDVAVNRYMCEFIFIDLGGVDIDVHDLAVLGELGELAGDPVVEPHAQGQQQVGLVDGVVRIDRAVHAQHVEREVVVAGQGAQAVHGHRHGDSRLGRKLAQLLGRIGGHDAAAAVDDRPATGRDRREHLVDFAGGGGRRQPVAG